MNGLIIMAPLTRSRELLSLIDGLFFINQDTIDLASSLYSDLKVMSVNVGEEPVEKLIPHITSLLSKLNEISQVSSELKAEVVSLQDKLTSAKKRCIDLNIGFKDKSLVCCELEEQYDTEVNSLTEQLTDYKSENERLRNQLDKALDTDALIAGYEAKLTTLTDERKNLLTTMEVLEADVKCLRAELRRAESRAKQRRSSAGDDILSGISMSEAICGQSPLTPGPSKQSCSRVDDPVTTPSAPPPPHTTVQPIPIR
ncbi:hypothetical protein J6590_065116 [Homalodisca vitripennis]|nr:hypothetical protein J6590_065116 [Homalodisca vitripennis]